MLGPRNAIVAPPADHLVGRAAELGSLEEAQARFVRQGFTALEISGEPGIGKTRLLAELARTADGRGHLVLAGAASELEPTCRSGVFVDALDEYVHGLPPHRLDELGDEARDELAHVLPSLAPAAVPRPSATASTVRSGHCSSSSPSARPGARARRPALGGLRLARAARRAAAAAARRAAF